MLLRAFPLWSSTGWTPGPNDQSGEALGSSLPHFLFTLHAGGVFWAGAPSWAPEVNFPVGLHCSFSPFPPTLASLLPRGPLLTLSWRIGHRFSGGSWGARSWAIWLLWTSSSSPQPPRGDHLPHRPSPLVSLCRNATSWWAVAASRLGSSQLFRSLNPQEICVTLPCWPPHPSFHSARGQGPRVQRSGPWSVESWSLAPDLVVVERNDQTLVSSPGCFS